MTNFTAATRTASFTKAALHIAIGLGLAAMAASASAHRITTVSQNNSGYVVSDSDLLSGLSGVIAGNVNSEEGLQSNTSGSALTDGQFGLLSIDSHANPGMVMFHDNASITYNLAPSAAGYTINTINSYSGWRDSGRVEQDYSIWFSFASDPTSFTKQFDVTSGINSSNDVFVNTTHPGTVLGSNVTGIRFLFTDVQNGYVGYRELDVFGSAAAAPAVVPEPASMALLGLGAVAMTAIRRRRNVTKA